MPIELGVIGGTGLYQIAALANARRVRVDTPFGAPSGEVVVGKLGQREIAFLARHGEKHTLAPHRVNYRANVWALHHLGAPRVVGVNAVGGITARMGPRVVAVPNQVIDYTHGRLTTYCDAEGAAVDHIEFGEPYDEVLRRLLLAAAVPDGGAVDGGVHGVTQGPRLETMAEVSRMARDGCDLVGMTGMPEAALARELKLPYACLALVANWAAGCDGHGTERPVAPISLDEIFENLRIATARVPGILQRLVEAD
jgi:5'-methylthioinosine phosphorylase